MGNFITKNYKEDYKNGYFRGKIVKDEKNGQFFFKNGNIYNGSIKNNTYYGFGSIFNKDYKIKGNWINNKLNGKGFIEFKDVIYKGDFLNGIPNGIGEIKNNNGFSYYGEISNNIINGYGILKKDNNKIYTGIWRKNIPLNYYNYDNSLELLKINDVNKLIPIIEYKSKVCPICNKYSNQIIYPCLHMTLCVNCAKDINECLICGKSFLE